MVYRSVKVRLGADVQPFVAGIRTAKREAQSFHGQLSKQEAEQRRGWQMQAQAEKEMAAEFEKRMGARREVMTKVGMGMVAFGAATVGGLGLATKAAIGWESAWAGVTKTVDGSTAQMAVLESGLRDLAKVLPASHEEIAGVAEAAGQLGVQREGILSFTKTMIDLGVSTNLTADEAATAIAQMANIMGTEINGANSEVSNMGATIVALGNQGASTERQIVDMSLRLAGAGKLIGASEADVLALANAMSSMGIEAQLGGGAMSRVMLQIFSAVKSGGDELEGFARVAGMSATQFAEAFQRDPVRAIDAFVQGLNRIDESGGNVVAALEDLGIEGTQDLQVLLRLKGAGDLLTESLDLGARAWKDNTALIEEANKRYETTAARLAIARNQLNDFAIDIGQTFLPAVGGAADRLGSWLQVLQGLPGPVKETGSVVGALAGAASLAGGAFFLAAPKVAAFKASIADLGPRGQVFARGLSGAAGILGGPWGIAIAGGITALGLFIDAKAKAAQEVREYTRALQSDSGALGDNTRALVAHKLEQEGSLQVAQRLGVDLSTLTEAVLGNRAAYEQVRGQLSGYARAAADAQYIDSGRIADAQTLMDVINGQSGAVKDAAESYKREAAAAGTSADAVDKQGAASKEAGAATGALGGALGDTTGDMKEQKSAADRLKDSIDELTGATRAAYGSETAFRSSVLDLSESLKENGRTFSLNTRAGLANRSALLAAAEAANQHAQDVANQTGNVDKGSRVLAGHRAQLEKVLVQSGYTREEARKYVAQLLKVPRKVETDVRADTRPATRAIGAFEQNVNQMLGRIRGPHKVTVSVSGNFVQRAGGRIFERDGGIVDYYANGGMREQHVAQMAPAGAWRVWAEDETGGEAYIPLAPGKRERSKEILQAVAERFGMRTVPMADGAILMRLLGQQSGVSGQDRLLRELALRAQKDSRALSSGAAALASYRGGRGVEQWRSVALQALAAAGAPSSWIGSLLRRMNQESGGNPRAVNLWDCLTIDAMILTRRGWLKHDEVRVGDETIGYNQATGRNEWTPITRIVHYADAPLVRLSNSRWHATTTPNHRWLNLPRVNAQIPELTGDCPYCEWPKDVRRRGRTTQGGLRIHLAKAHGVAAKPHRSRHETDAQWITSDAIRSRDRLLLAAPAETDGRLSVSIQEAALLGWIAGDGHVETRKHGPSISIAQSKPAMVIKLRRLLNGIPHAAYVDNQLTRADGQACGPRYQFRLDHRYAQKLLRRVGNPKTDAVQQVLRMDAEQRAAWLQGVIDAEGTIDRNGKPKVYQTPGALLEATALAFYLSGYRPRIRSVNRPNRPDAWAAESWVTGNNPVVTGTSLRKEDAGHGDVWCVTTELGSWTAREDDHIFLTGNSNAQRGYPSAGLMQVIRPTFQAYAGPFRNKGPFMYGTSIDPLANIYSSIKYANARYGSAPRGWDRPGGYDLGGVARGTGYIPKLTPAPERVLSPVQTRAFERLADRGFGGGGNTVVVQGNVLATIPQLENLITRVFDNLRSQGRV